VGKSASSELNFVDFEERARELTERAQKLRRKGELRRAVLAMREACAVGEPNSARWMMLGDMLARTGARDEAGKAMEQALYLCRRRGEKAKANVIRGLLLHLAAVTPDSSPRHG
jgi:Flp pilus assembly protein TadD